MNQTLDAVVEIFRETIPEIEIDPATDASRTFKQLGMDSLEKMSLLLSIQDKWNLDLTEDEISGLQSLQDICNVVEKATC